MNLFNSYYHMPVLLLVLITISCAKSGPDQDSNLKRRIDSVVSITLDKHLIAHWDFDDNDTNLIDHSENMINGVIYGAISSSGVIMDAFDFDGVDDYIRIPGNDSDPPTAISNLNAGSISVWFKCDSIPLQDGIMPIFYYGSNDNCLNMFDASNQGLIIEIGHSPVHYQSKRLYFTQFTNGCTYPSLCFDTDFGLVENRWYHFIAVVGDDFNTGYLNGEELTSRFYNFGNAASTLFINDAKAHETIFIGKGYWNQKTVFFDGQIDDVRIYDKALDDREAKFLFDLQQSSLLPFDRDPFQ